MADEQVNSAFFVHRWKTPARGSKIPFCGIPITGYKRCFLLGGGTSLNGFEFRRLVDEFTIGINRTLFFTNPNINFLMDYPLYVELIKTKVWHEYKGIKLVLDLSNMRFDDVYYLRHIDGKMGGFSRSFEEGIYHGNNSGYGALQVAILLGFKEIYLLGYDMKLAENGAGHHHEELWPTRANYQKILDNFTLTFGELAPQLRANGIRVVNLNKDSALRCFEFGDINEL